MTTIMTYKCPNCDAGLVFDPKSQNFICEYCSGSFSRNQMEQIKDGQPLEQSNGKESKADTAAKSEYTPSLYSCPNCGAEMATDETTAATTCFYCHNPVVFSGKLEGEYQPDKIVPFVIDKEQAAEQFLKWVQKKKFIPKNFFSKDQIEAINGIYFPYWLVDSTASARIQGSATKVKRYTRGDYEITETDHYHITRGGHINFDKAARRALDKQDSVLVDTVHPYNLEKIPGFSTAYLSGFQAEKRNIDKEVYEDSLKQEIKSKSRSLLQNSASGYQSVSISDFTLKSMKLSWQYTLLPVWTLTYRGKGDEIHFYTMNGQTGKVTGKLPLDKKKLNTFFGVISGIVFVLMLLGMLGGKML